MKICLFHPKRLPPRDYGGVERVVLWLASGLRERGHEVWVAALEGSRLPTGIHLLAMKQGSTSALDLLPLLPAGIELVHFMAPPESGVLENLPCAGLLTVHGNGKPGERFPLNTVFLSADHARRHGAESFVYNGIDPAEFICEPGRPREPWMLFLSKTSWRVKNLGGAMDLCARAQVHLRIAGGSRPWGRRLQAAWSSHFDWLGPVSGPEKARLLSQARALVFPVLWPEPFGLVVVEALMSGLPVLGSRIGSLPELVPPDVGMLLPMPGGMRDPSEAREEWLTALRRAQAGEVWEAERCRQWAIEKFHYLKMAEDYENAYKRVMGGETIQTRVPVARLGPEFDPKLDERNPQAP